MNPDEILSRLTALAGLRGKPVLLLSLKEVNTEAIFRVQHKLKNKNLQDLDVVLQTPGGNADAAFTIVKLIRSHASNVNVIVPFYAKSAGTLICLAANKLIMNEISELGPLDTQIRQTRQGDVSFKSALDGFMALEEVRRHALENLDMAAMVIVRKSGLKMADALSIAVDFSGTTSSCLYNQLDPLAMGEYRRALEIGQRYGRLILTRYMGWDPDRANETVSNLIFNYPSHNSIIDMQELREMGFFVEEINPDERMFTDGLPILLENSGESMIELIESRRSVAEDVRREETTENVTAQSTSQEE